jgi:hypothetical protein
MAVPRPTDDSTLRDVRRDHSTRDTRPRRLVLVLLAVLVVAGAAGAFGVRRATAAAAAGAYRLELTYPRIARAGLDVPWHVRVVRAGGFDPKTPVTLAVTADYFDIFETQGFHPEPDQETRDGEMLYLSFTAPPSGDVFEVDFDTYVQPSSQIGRDAALWVMDRGRRAVGVTYSTWLVP